jgi:hypothetical protein
MAISSEFEHEKFDDLIALIHGKRCGESATKGMHFMEIASKVRSMAYGSYKRISHSHIVCQKLLNVSQFGVTNGLPYIVLTKLHRLKYGKENRTITLMTSKRGELTDGVRQN